MTVTAFLLSSNVVLFGQNATQLIRGTVIDEDTQIPLIGATVSVLNVEPLIGTTTDEEGVFRLEKVSIGRVNLMVSYIGYQDKFVSNIEVNSAKEIILDFTLVESVESLTEVVVTASAKKGTALNELAVVSARSISAEQTSRYAGGFNDPAKITGNFAGVTNSQDGGNDIIIRGNSPKYVGWRLEGAEITNPNHFGDPSSISGSTGALNNNLLSTSDFYTGAFPAEFGDALSGVYDVRMRKGNNEKFEGIFGFGLLGTELTVEGPFKKGYKGSYLANFRYSTIGAAIELGVVPVEGASLTFQDAAFKIYLPTKQLGTFSIFGLQGNSNFTFLDINPGVIVTPGNDFAQTDINEDFNKGSNLLNIGVKHILNISPKSYVKTTLLFSSEGIRDEVFENILSVDSIPESRLNFNSDLKKNAYKWNTQYKYKLNAKNKFSAGIQFTLFEQDLRQSVLDEFVERQTLVDFEDNISSLRSFLNWKYIPTEQLRLVVGLHNTNIIFNNKFTLEPRVAANYNLNNSSSISFGFGLHSRMESIHNYFARVEQTDGTVTTPNLDLGLIKARHYVIGYDKYFSKDLRIKVEGYLQDLYNVPVEDNLNSSYTTLNEGLELNYVGLINEGTGKNYGVELTVERFLKKGFYFLFNTSLYESKYTALDRVERNTRFNGNYIFNILAGKEFAELGKKKNQIFAVNIKTFFGGGRYFIPLRRDANGQVAVDIDNGLIFDFAKAYEDKLDDIRNITFSLSYKWNKKKTTQELFLNIDNLTNNQARLREFYDVDEPDGVAYERQVGIIPNFLYRIYF
ncbi:MAG: carboxypeptidase-like regulatory domain-containing protein [Saprospiraceae bacterium]